MMGWRILVITEGLRERSWDSRQQCADCGRTGGWARQARVERTGWWWEETLLRMAHTQHSPQGTLWELVTLTDVLLFWPLSPRFIPFRAIEQPSRELEF